jgi:CheY-like chemotaxis protein
MLATGLERLGYRILKAGDPLEALDLFRRNPAAVDVLVSDVMMPHMTGSALARQLLSERPELRVVLISGYASDVLEREPPPDDAVVLQKPFTANQVAIQVGVLLQRPAP